jgi:hypothetical protein
VVPSIRVYSQSESFFYDVFYRSPRDDNYYSTDYRLSEYGGYTYGLKLIKNFDKWKVNLSLEEYRSAGNYGFSNEKIENPGLVDFTIISVGFDMQF